MATSRAKKNPRGAFSSRAVGGRAIMTDYEPRPNVRIVSKANWGSKGKSLLRAFGRKILDLVMGNIRSNMQGRWTPIQYGDKAGSRALQGTEDQWTVDVKTNRTVVVRPKQQYRKIWRGHAHPGELIIEPKTKPYMKFIGYDGSVVRTKEVVMPPRDPRPTESQIRVLSRS